MFSAPCSGLLNFNWTDFMFQELKEFPEISLNGLIKFTPGISVTCPVTARKIGSTELVNGSAPSESKKLSDESPLKLHVFQDYKVSLQGISQKWSECTKTISSSVSKLPTAVRNNKQQPVLLTITNFTTVQFIIIFPC